MLLCYDDQQMLMTKNIETEKVGLILKALTLKFYLTSIEIYKFEH